MKIPRTTLSLIAALIAMSPSTTLAIQTITSKNGHMQMNLFGAGDTLMGEAVTVNWTTEQIAAAQTVIDTWSEMFRNTPSRTIVGNMCWESMGGNTLGSSQSNMGAYNGNGYNWASTTEIVWREGAESTLDPMVGDFVLRFSTDYAFSTGAVTPANQVDLVSVLLHEVGHNVGFNSTNYGAPYQNTFTVWDSLIRDSNGKRPGDPDFNYMEGYTYTIGSGGLNVYNPAPFEPGSSMAHIDPTTDPNALMQPSIGNGVQVRTLSNSEKALLTEMGWVFTDDPTYYASVDGTVISKNLDAFFTRVLVNRNLSVDAEANSDTISLKNLSGKDSTLTLTIAQGKGTTVTLDNSENSICNAIILGNDANFEKKGTQNLSINGNFTTSGHLKVTQGGISLAGETNSLGEIELTGGTLAISKLGTHDVTATTARLNANSGMLSLINGASLVVQGANNTINSGVNLSGQGTIKLDTAATLTFNGSNSIKESILISGADQGTLSISGGTLSLTGNARLDVTTISFASPSSALNLGTNSGTIVEKLAGTGVISSSGGQITLNSATDSSWDGSFSGQGILNKKGANKLSLTGVGGTSFSLSAQTGSLELNNGNARYLAIGMNGGTLIVTQKATISLLQGLSGTVSLNSGTLTLEGTGNTLSEKAVLTGNGALNIASNGNLTIQKDHTISTDITIGGSGVLRQQDGKLTLANNAKLQNVALLVGADESLPSSRAGSNATVDIGSTQQSVVSGLYGNGTIAANQGKLTIQANNDSSFSGDLAGTGTIAKNGTGNWKYTGPGSKTFNMLIHEGKISLVRDTESPIVFQDFKLESGTSMNISMLNSSANYNTTLSISGTGEFQKGSSVSLHVNPLLTQYKAPIIFTEGQGTLDITGTTFYVSSYVTDTRSRLSWTLLSGDITSKDIKITASGALAASYTNIRIQDNGSGDIIVTGDRKAENPFLATSDSVNSSAGAELLWNVDTMEDGTHLGFLNGAVSEAWNTGNYAEANRILNATAGSTIPTIIVAQHVSARREINFIRNRIPSMQMEPNLDQAEFPRTNWWMEATSGYDKLNSSGELSGYSLSSWGGRTGVDINLNQDWIAGAAFSASYGSYSAQAGDHADGNIDSFFANVFAHLQKKKWGHSFILTGGIFNASIDRDVTHALDSYRTTSSTNGSSIAAMYELSYDIALNESQTALFQPIMDISIIHSSVDGFDESGADSTNLRADSMSMTTGAIAIGGRLSGTLDYSLKGRPIVGELKAMISQDFGSMGGKANVAYLNNPGFKQTVHSAEMGKTAIQIGAGLNCPCSDNGAIYADVMAELRSDNSNVGGSIGYRYNF